MKRRNKYNNLIKKQAEQMRLNGCSYKEIKNKFNIPKSTLSTWFGEKYSYVFDKKAQLKHLEKIRPLAIRAKARKIEDEIKEIRVKITNDFKPKVLISKKVKMAMFSMLYWAEGAKYKGVSGLKFVNTDPDLMLLYVTLLRECFDIDEKRLRARVHVHHYHDPLKVKKFWSDMLNIPLSQFGRIYIKERSKTKKFRQNFMGICFVSYGGARKVRETMELAKYIKGVICQLRS